MYINNKIIRFQEEFIIYKGTKKCSQCNKYKGKQIAYFEPYKPNLILCNNCWSLLPQYNTTYYNS